MLKKDKKGFTIIEVLIVIAIGGAIMLVVFLAVPALQRNSRNNSYRAEANRYGSAYAEVIANKGGSALSTTDALVTSVPATPTTDSEKVYVAANPKDYINFRIVAPASAPTQASVTSFSSQMTLVQGGKCNAADSWKIDSGSARQAALLYTVETRTGISHQCQNI